MNDEQKTRSELLAELRILRKQLTDQEALRAQNVEVEKALRESEGNLRTFMENARGFGVYSLEPAEEEEYGSRIVFASPSIGAIFGLEDPDNNANWFQDLHPDDLERMAEAHHVALTETKEFDETYRYFHKARQEWRWGRAISSLVTIEGGASKRFNGLVMDVTDIKLAEETLQKSHDYLEKQVKERTADLAEANQQLRVEVNERKQAENALLQSQKQLQRYITAIDDIGLGLCVIDDDYTFRYMNNTFTGWFGEQLGNNCHLVLKGLKSPCPGCLLQNGYDASKGICYDSTMIDEVSYEIVATSLTNSDNSLSDMLIFRDITEQKIQEEERLKTSQQKEQLKKLASLKTMAGAIAHRFNNAMTGVEGNLELLTFSLPDKSRELQMVTDALQAARGATQIGSMMLSYVGQKTLDLVKVSLTDLVCNTLQKLQNDLPAGIFLEVTPPQHQISCMADISQMEEVIKHLFSNALESIGEEVGTIKITFGTDVVTSDSLPLFFQESNFQDGSYVFCQIEDSGHGVDYDDIEHIFDPFYTTRSTGRGLGLALTAGIMQTHNGAITIESVLKQGAVVRMLLPSASPFPLAAHKETVVGRSGSISGNILLADDEQIVLVTVKMMLERIGFTVFTASNGQEAVEQIRRKDTKFCAVVLDVLMPVMDGVDAMNEIKTIDPSLPVLMISGYSRYDVSFLKNKPDAFLTKPIQQQEMQNTIGMLLSG